MTSFSHSSPRHSRYNRMYAPQTFYCHESQLRSFWLRVFVTVHRAIRKNAAALLSAACAAPFAHRMALPSWCSTDRFSCKHEICLQNATSFYHSSPRHSQKRSCAAFRCLRSSFCSSNGAPFVVLYRQIFV